MCGDNKILRSIDGVVNGDFKMGAIITYVPCHECKPIYPELVTSPVYDSVKGMLHNNLLSMYYKTV